MLKVDHVSFGYTKKEVLKNISFKADKGKYIAVVGESGCGKSTLLEIIYGLLHIEKGAVYWNDKKLLGPNFYLIPGENFMKYLPQNFDLMPFTTVAENVGKYISALDPEKENRILELLEVVDMSDFYHTKIKNLSGGQKQRVALAKVIAKEPEVLLLDEPFSHIDNFRKNKLRRDLFKYLKSKNILCIVATHDTTDALSFADEILVIKNGELVAKNTPQALYNQPKNKYIASFFNEINEIHLPEKKNKLILAYPHEIKAVKKSILKAHVVENYFQGKNYLIQVELNNRIIFFEHHEELIKNSIVFLEIQPTALSRESQG